MFLVLRIFCDLHELVSVFVFLFPSRVSPKQLPVAIFGDLGVTNAVAVPALKGDVQKGKFKLAVHAGDIAVSILTMYIPYKACTECILGLTAVHTQHCGRCIPKED